jgi:hypothetical protein
MVIGNSLRGEKYYVDRFAAVQGMATLGDSDCRLALIPVRPGKSAGPALLILSLASMQTIVSGTNGECPKRLSKFF